MIHYASQAVRLLLPPQERGRRGRGDTAAGRHCKVLAGVRGGVGGGVLGGFKERVFFDEGRNLVRKVRARLLGALRTARAGQCSLVELRVLFAWA